MNRGLARHSAGTDTTRSTPVVGRLMHGPVPRPFSPPPFHNRSRPSRDDGHLLPATDSHGPRTTSDVVAAPREMHGARTIGVGPWLEARSHGTVRNERALVCP